MNEQGSSEERLTLNRPKSRKSIEFEVEHGDLCITLSGGDLEMFATTYLSKDEGRLLLDLMNRWLA